MIDRRTFTKAAVAAGGLAVAGSRWGGVAAEGTIATAPQRIVGVDLSSHPVPIPPHLDEIIDFDPALLDQLARDYWDTYGRFQGKAPNHPTVRADFWFRYVALPLQQKAMQGLALGGGANAIPIEKGLALMHHVGYFGGIWFFKKIDEFQHGSNASRANCGHPTPPPAASEFAFMARSLKEIVDVARTGSSRHVLDRAERAIWDVNLVGQITNGDDLPTRRGMIGGYSYNVGYCNTVLIPDDRPLPDGPLNPGGPTPYDPPWNSLRFTPFGVFDATYPAWADPRTAEKITPLPPNPLGTFTPVPYLTGDSPALAIARKQFVNARREHPQHYRRLVLGLRDRHGNLVGRGDLRVLAQLGFNTGTATWTALPFLDIRHWDAESFQLLNALDIYFLQAVQTAGMADMAAAANSSVNDARNALAATALVLPFGLSYLIGSNAVDSPAYACRNADQSVPMFKLGPA